jgi:hypothetical protein
MFDIFYNNLEYTKLSNQRGILSEQHGFPYLNSAYCTEILKRIHILEENILRMINQENLFQTYKNCLDINDKHENEMIKNIYSYCTFNKYNWALFLIGGEHRRPLLGKMQKIEKNY